MAVTSQVQNAVTLGDTVDVTAAYNAVKNSNGKLVDVRTPGEFASGHAADAVNIPLTDLPGRSGEVPTDRPVLLICQSGQRSGTALQQLKNQGYENASSVQGGFFAWEKAQLPLVKGKGAIPLERQVRIAAGALVFVFSVLGFLVSHYFFIGSLFIGFMLTFTGIIGICPMMSFLSIMPWNRGNSAS
jgi:rhodanese-related sulfurtransferase